MAVTSTYDWPLVAFSIAIAFVASYTALDLAGRVTAAKGRARAGWLIGGAVAIGIGIWSMHFIAMLAFFLPLPVTYHIPTVILSMLAAIIASGAALFWVSRPALILPQFLGGSVFMGLAIASTHYIGMLAMRVMAIARYDLRVVAISVVIAICVSFVALLLAFWLREDTTVSWSGRKVGSAIVMGAAIAAMHYTGMAAVTFKPLQVNRAESLFLMDPSWLAIAIGIAALVIQGFALLSSFVERQLATQNARASAIASAQTQQLELALQKLKQTQLQLIQAEKMSSLGQLTAGIAHEINNPLNFIYGNLGPTREYIQALLYLLGLYQQRFPDPGAEIEAQIEQMDLEFIIEELPQMLASMKIGTERLREIVRSMRNFSRLDEANVKLNNIHDGIDSTLLILQNRLKGKLGRPDIVVVKEYGDLPLVECYAGQLNQVFMNIFSNAIDALSDFKVLVQARFMALESRYPADGGHNGQSTVNTPQLTPTIRIRTGVLDGDRVAIGIADNGAGMPEDVRRRIFDPFFTTKPVGEGTGLGLSISYQIIEKHCGQIQCISAPGQGTEFIIEIPIQQQKQQSASRVAVGAPT